MSDIGDAVGNKQAGLVCAENERPLSYADEVGAHGNAGQVSKVIEGRRSDAANRKVSDSIRDVHLTTRACVSRDRDGVIEVSCPYELSLVDVRQRPGQHHSQAE